jgi:hypothetical protein
LHCRPHHQWTFVALYVSFVACDCSPRAAESIFFDWTDLCRGRQKRWCRTNRSTTRTRVTTGLRSHPASNYQNLPACTFLPGETFVGYPLRGSLRGAGATGTDTEGCCVVGSLFFCRCVSSIRFLPRRHGSRNSRGWLRFRKFPQKIRLLLKRRHSVSRGVFVHTAVILISYGQWRGSSTGEGTDRG